MRLRKKPTILSDEAIAIVDIYAKGTVYRAGVSTISVDDPVYKNSSWAFRVLEVENE